MPTLIVTDRDGQEHALEAQNGMKVMEVIRDAGLPIEAACGGACSCATCHVYVDTGYAVKLTEADEMETEMLEFADHVEETSRLSCQIEVSDALDGIRLTIAPE